LIAIFLFFFFFSLSSCFSLLPHVG
jgi:hypothetical protein